MRVDVMVAFRGASEEESMLLLVYKAGWRSMRWSYSDYGTEFLTMALTAPGPVRCPLLVALRLASLFVVFMLFPWCQRKCVVPFLPSSVRACLGYTLGPVTREVHHCGWHASVWREVLYLSPSCIGCPCIFFGRASRRWSDVLATCEYTLRSCTR